MGSQKSTDTRMESIHIDEKPLMWWMMRESQYSLMSNLAKKTKMEYLYKYIT